GCAASSVCRELVPLCCTAENLNIRKLPRGTLTIRSSVLILSKALGLEPSKFLCETKVVRPQERHQSKEAVERRGDFEGSASNRRGHGGLFKFQPESSKQFCNFAPSDPSHIGIFRIGEREIVPDEVPPAP